MIHLLRWLILHLLWPLIPTCLAFECAVAFLNNVSDSIECVRQCVVVDVNCLVRECGASSGAVALCVVANDMICNMPIAYFPYIIRETLWGWLWAVGCCIYYIGIVTIVQGWSAAAALHSEIETP